MSDHAAAHRAIVIERFPDLRMERFEPIGDGWTYDTYRIDDAWIVQFPRTDHAATTLRMQIQVLPELANEVSAPVPMPELVSFEPLCMGYRLIAGVPFTQVGEDGVWPERLGRFLYDLHLVPPEYLGMRPRGMPAFRDERAAQLSLFRDRAFPLLEPRERERAAGAFDTHIDDDANWRFAECVTHGDLGPAHILASPTGDLAGVIDWEEVGMGDPARDFAWMLHAYPGAGERALAAYGGQPDARFRERAWFAFLQMPWHEVMYGLETDQPSFVESGLVGVRERLDA